MILATNNYRPKKYSFRNPDLSLHDLLMYGKTLEETEAQAEKVKQAHDMSQEEVSYNKRGQTSGDKFG